MQGRTLSAEYDGEVLLDDFKYHDWMINMEPAPIRLQKQIVVNGDNLGKENPCPIEYRNIFIKELAPGAPPTTAAEPEGDPTPRWPNAALLARIAQQALPGAYDPRKHQDYVDRRLKTMTNDQKIRLSQLWKEKQKIDPGMKNRGASFVRILEHVSRPQQ